MPVSALSPVCSQSLTSKSPKSPLSHSPTPSVLSSSLQTVRYASEQGRRLAHRSRTSFNRLLDCVIDNATAFAESGSWHSRYSDIDHRVPFAIHSPVDTSCRSQTPSHEQGPKPKFFVCEDDSEDEEDDQPDWVSSSFRIPGVAPNNITDRQDSDCEDGDHDNQDKIKDTDDDALFNQYRPFPRLSHQAPSVGRRHSLLSDLLLAEKLLTTQRAAPRRPTDSTAPSWTPSNTSSRCPSSANSDGELSHSSLHLYRPTRTAVQSTPQTLAGLAHQTIQSNQRQSDRSFVRPSNDLPSKGASELKGSALRRAKKSMFKNLDELVVKSETGQS
ncbi:hypothetical protein BGZ65_005132, partial [Modicella reniformis]